MLINSIINVVLIALMNDYADRKIDEKRNVYLKLNHCFCIKSTQFAGLVQVSVCMIKWQTKLNTKQETTVKVAHISSSIAHLKF